MVFGMTGIVQAQAGAGGAAGGAAGGGAGAGTAADLPDRLAGG